MKRDTLIQTIAACVACLSLVVSGMLAMGLTTSASRNKLTYTVHVDKADTPEVALGIAMGAFRGIFVNFLWIRANDLKEAGRYHEAVDLASAITKLQPRFSEVWTFHAWNLAYNISVATHTPEERWYWVRSGLDLLRKEGIQHNPDNLRIHKELGWILLHKIQGYTDDANGYYKREWAIEWTEVLGPPPPSAALLVEDGDREAFLQEWADWLRPLTEAPDTLEEVIANDRRERAKEERADEPGVRALVDAIGSAGWKLDVATLREYTYHSTLAESMQKDVVLEGMPQARRALYGVVNDERFKEAWSKLIPHLRRRVLIDEYKMEPSRMLRYTLDYGPMDWRHPASHAVYWVRQGVEGALQRVGEKNAKDYDFLNTDRVWIQSVQELYRSGDIFFDYIGHVTSPENPMPYFIALPHPYFALTYQNSLAEVMERGGLVERKGDRLWTLYAAGFENFMKDVIRFYWRRGQKELAATWKNRLRDWENQNLMQGRVELYSLPIEEFITAELRDRMDSPQVAQSEIYGALQAAYLQGILSGNMELFKSNMQYARLCHEYYFQKQGRESMVTGAPDPKELYIPRDFEVLAGYALRRTIAGLDIDAQETVFNRAPENLKRFAYDWLVETIKPRMDAQAARGGRSFESIFPQPAGMAEHHARIERAYQRQVELERLRQGELR